MKKWKKYVLSCMAAMTAVSLTACAKRVPQKQPEVTQEQESLAETEEKEITPQEAIAAAAMKLADVDSLDASITVDLGLKVLGQQFDATALLDMTTFQSPMKMKADLSLDLGILGTNKMQIYALEKDGRYGLYFGNAGSWTRQEVQAIDLKKYNGRKVMDIYLDKIGELTADGKEILEQKESLGGTETPGGTGTQKGTETPGGTGTQKGTETLKGIETSRYSGVIHGDTLMELFANSGISDSMNALMANDVLKPLGALLNNHEELIAEIFENAQDIPVSLWIDTSSGYPVKCSMDITDIVSRVFTEINKNSTDKVSTANILSEVSISKTNITVECKNFNESEDFTIPSKVLAAKEVGSQSK